jgi:hypothetical protein
MLDREFVYVGGGVTAGPKRIDVGGATLVGAGTPAAVPGQQARVTPYGIQHGLDNKYSSATVETSYIWRRLGRPGFDSREHSMKQSVTLSLEFYSTEASCTPDLVVCPVWRFKSSSTFARLKNHFGTDGETCHL